MGDIMMFKPGLVSVLGWSVWIVFLVRRVSSAWLKNGGRWRRSIVGGGPIETMIAL